MDALPQSKARQSQLNAILPDIAKSTLALGTSPSPPSMVGGGKAADSRGEFFGCAAGVGDGASAWDFQPAPVRLAQGVSRRSAWRHCRIRAGGDRGGAA